jgi:3-dehydroquinate dehydratase-2
MADKVDGFLINPAALTRFGAPTKIAFADVRRPFIELHFANVAALGWEGGITMPVATGVTMGFRQHGYMGALFGFACALDRGIRQASLDQESPS